MQLGEIIETVYRFFYDNIGIPFSHLFFSFAYFFFLDPFLGSQES